MMIGLTVVHHQLQHLTEIQSIFQGLNAAVVGLIAAAGVSLARTGLHSTLSYGIAGLAFLLLLRVRVNPVLIILGCGVLQLIMARLLPI